MNKINNPSVQKVVWDHGGKAGKGHRVFVGSWVSSYSFHSFSTAFYKSPTRSLQVSYIYLTSLINTRVMGYGSWVRGHGVGVIGWESWGRGHVVGVMGHLYVQR